MKTQIRFQQIANNNLTGATFSPALKFYDETQSYSVGDVVFFGGKLHKAIQDIPASREGDLQYAPYNDPNWVEVQTVRVIENSYQEEQTISLQKYSDSQLLQIYKKHTAENNVNLNPISLIPDNFYFYEFFTHVSNYLKLKDSVKYYTTYENNLYHKFRLYTKDYVNIYEINSTDS